MGTGQKISIIPAKTDLTGKEYIPLQDGPRNTKVSVDDLLAKTNDELAKLEGRTEAIKPVLQVNKSYVYIKEGNKVERYDLPNYKCTKIRAYEGDTFIISTKGAGTAFPYYFVNASLQILSKSEELKYGTFKVTAPAGTDFLIVNQEPKSPKPLEVELLGRFEQKNGERIDTLENIALRENLPANMLIMGYGQSLMAGSYSTDPVSITQKYNNLFKFSVGPRVVDTFALTTKRHAYLTRKGSPAYGEIFKNPTETLSAYDNECINKAFAELVPLTENFARYKEDTSISANPRIKYTRDMSGSIKDNNENGETPITGFCTKFNDVLSDKYNSSNFGYEIIGAAPCYGGASFDSLMPLDKGGKIHYDTEDACNINYFELLMLTVVKANEKMKAEGKKLNVPCILYFHEMVTVAWNLNLKVHRLLQLFSLINTRVKEITGQRNDIVFVMHQSALDEDQNATEYLIGTSDKFEMLPDEINAANKNLPNPEVEEYDLKNVILGGPMYPYKYVWDHVHKTSTMQRVIGETFALAYLNHKPYQRYKPLYPEKVKVINNDIYVTYHVPCSPIVIDPDCEQGTEKNQACIDRGDKFGFAITNGLAKKERIFHNIITDVKVVDANQIKISCSESPVGKFLEYAFALTQNAAWPTQQYGQYGNIHDSQTDTVEIRGEQYHLWNWATSFKVKLT